MTNSVYDGIVSRAFQNDDDFWAVRKLIVDTYPITPTGFNWEVRRWDGWRFYDADPAWRPEWEKKVRVWENADGEIVGAVFAEGSSDAVPQIHPDYRHLEEEMITWAEGVLGAPSKDGKHRELFIHCYNYDVRRQMLLEKMGYEQSEGYGVIRRLRFGRWELPEPELAEGYTIRTTRPGDMDDCQQIADILNAAFRRDFHTAKEFYEFTVHAKSFRHDLDFVAVAPDGSFASYVGVPFDADNNIGIFEPVCTHPDHQRKGLGKALMLEALHRAKALGINDVYVGTGDMIPANRLYDSVGFTEKYAGYYWKKELPLLDTDKG